PATAAGPPRSVIAASSPTASRSTGWALASVFAGERTASLLLAGGGTPAIDLGPSGLPHTPLSSSGGFRDEVRRRPRPPAAARRQRHRGRGPDGPGDGRGGASAVGRAGAHQRRLRGVGAARGSGLRRVRGRRRGPGRAVGRLARGGIDPL